MTASEHSDQAAVFAWAEAQSYNTPELQLLYAVPNAGRRSYGAAAYMKAEGLKSGVPDMHLPVARGGFFGLYIEQKTRKGKVSSTQKWWIRQLFKQGYAVHVCYSFDETIATLKTYLALEPTKIKGFPNEE